MDAASEIEHLLYSRLDAYPLALPSPSRHAEAAGLDMVRELCDGRSPFRDVLPKLHAGALATLFDSVMWLDEPLPDPLPTGERCLIVSADPEQTFLSMSGYLMKRRGQLDCLNIICFSPPGSMPGTGLTAFNEVRLARRDDANLCARLTGVGNMFLELPSHTVRDRLAGGMDRIAHEAFLRALLGALIYHFVETHRPARVFVPAAMGKNRDNQLLFDTAMQLFENGYFPGVRYDVFETLPEAAAHIEVDSFLSSFENIYTRVSPWFEDVTDVSPRKCQILDAIRAIPGARLLVRSVSERNAVLGRRDPGAAVERFWTLGLTFGSV